MSARSTRRQALATAAAIALLTSAAVAMQPQPTNAAFTDNEYARATVSAGELVAPTIASCTVQTGLGLVFQSVTITWTSLYPRDQVRLSATRSGTTRTIPTAQIAVSGPVNGLYTYSATLSNGLLAELLGNLFGSTTTLTVWNAYPGNWVSPTRTRQLDIALLGLNPRCT